MPKTFKAFIFIFITVFITACTNFFFQPSKKLVVDPAQLGIEYKSIYFDSTDNLNLHGWWFPAQDEARALVLYLHGNAQNISTHSSAVHWLTHHQYDVFIFDYRGYGLSEGTPELDMIIQDIQQAYAYTNKLIKSENKLFVIGHSLGASMGIYSIANRPDGIDGAIFISPFSDYQKITQHALAGSWLTWALQWPLSYTINNDYSPLNYVQKLPPIPLLYLYSEADEVIPPAQVKALFKNSKQPKSLAIIQGTHNRLFDIQGNRDIILKHLNQWLDQ